ncbi:uncharacterized protein LOC8072315 [Sorghum bicolor]|uniref:uncharacterized protein LOC8072315 n=1 Tax=Sorghum bicolor TaxID=4558 RepID=UPI000B426A23|nr:uncharacterized protein LOC8072315 [Sorghum bicolor]|eukprot:XP_021319321.1 uncharacterized protein LOC8072315 [Sorghum bicolor]
MYGSVISQLAEAGMGGYASHSAKQLSPVVAAGYTWQIRHFPNGRNDEGGDDDCISLYLELAHGELATMETTATSTTPSCTIIPSLSSSRLDDFIKWKDLYESGALKDDRFTIRCDITAIRDFSDLLWKQKHGADVAIDVAGETFDAHGWLLAAW